MHKIILTAQARKDLKEIKGYISRRLQNPIAAKNTLSAIMAEFHKLEQFPAMGSPVRDGEGEETAERVLSCKNYLAFYRLEEPKIYVDRVLYSHRDYAAILFPEELSPENGDLN